MRFILMLAIVLSASTAADTKSIPSAGTLLIERNQAGLTIRGDVSSIAHERILLETTTRDFAGLDIEMDVKIGSVMPPGWSLITDLTLRALSHTASSTAQIDKSGVVLTGYTTDSSGWFRAVARIEKSLSGEMALTSTVTAVSSKLTFETMCRQMFAAAFRSHRIKFAIGSSTLSSSSHALLDEIAEIGSDCPQAQIRITGFGDGGPDTEGIGLARANAVVNYLESAGFNLSRVEPLVAEDQSGRRIVFSVKFPSC